MEIVENYKKLVRNLMEMMTYYQDATEVLETELDDLNKDFEECYKQKCDAEAAFHQIADDSDQRCADLMETVKRQEKNIDQMGRTIDKMCSFISSIEKDIRSAVTDDDYQILCDLFDL